MRSETDVNTTIHTYADMVQRICLCHVKNYADTEDLFQTVFLKYMLYEGAFESEEHKKAWLIRVTGNACKDYLRTNFWKRNQTIETIACFAASADESHQEVLEAVLNLPEKYKDVIYLHYYEGYSAVEIAKILDKKENTIYSLLNRGRKILKEKLGGGIDE